MSIVVTERFHSRRLLGPTAELIFVARGTMDTAEALDAILAHAATVYPEGDRYIDHDGIETNRIGRNHVEARIPYVPSPGQTLGLLRERVVGTLQQQHVSEAEEVISVTASPYHPNVPHIGKAMNWDGEKVQGADVDVPSAKLVLEYRHLSIFYAPVNLAPLLRGINNATFRGFPAGTLKFEGFESDRDLVQAPLTVDVAYTFAISPNVANIDVGHGITVPLKRGHDYMWVHHGPWFNGYVMGTAPHFAVVNRTNPYIDYGALGIGT